MVDESIFNFVWQSFSVIKIIFTSIKISFGGATVNLLQFSLGIIVFGVIMGLFINYTKKQSASLFLPLILVGNVTRIKVINNE